MAAVTVLLDDNPVLVPPWVINLESFRRWLNSDDFPEHVRITYLKGEVLVDAALEQLFLHNHVKTEFAIVVGGFVNANELGNYFGDGAYLSNADGDVANQPDGVFVSHEAWQTDRVRLVPAASEGSVEMEGSPDMVLEIISPSSVQKDKVLLREAYWQANIREYWLADVRRGRLEFDIFRHAARGYVASGSRTGGCVPPCSGRRSA